MAGGPPKKGKKLQGGASTSRPEDNEKELAALAHSTDPHIIEIHKRIISVFDLFDQSGQKIIDELCPTEGDLGEIVEHVEEPSTKGFVKGDRFVPYMIKVILDGVRYQIPDQDRLRTAFQLIDRERKGFMEPLRLKELLMKEGEAFTQEEVDEMFATMVDKSDNKFYWEDYVDKIYKD